MQRSKRKLCFYSLFLDSSDLRSLHLPLAALQNKSAPQNMCESVFRARTLCVYICQKTLPLPPRNTPKKLLWARQGLPECILSCGWVSESFTSWSVCVCVCVCYIISGVQEKIREQVTDPVASAHIFTLVLEQETYFPTSPGASVTKGDVSPYLTVATRLIRLIRFFSGWSLEFNETLASSLAPSMGANETLCSPGR